MKISHGIDRKKIQMNLENMDWAWNEPPNVGLKRPAANTSTWPQVKHQSADVKRQINKEKNYQFYTIAGIGKL